MKAIRLREGKQRSLLRHHPWVFESSVARGRADAGETVRVEADDGSFLAWAAYSPASQIRLRAWSFDEAERIDAAFFERRIARAIALRARLGEPDPPVASLLPPRGAVQLGAARRWTDDPPVATLLPPGGAVQLGAARRWTSDGVRLVHGEADGLPGLIVDRYGDTLVAQFLSAGAERWKAAIADALMHTSGAARLYERSDASVRGQEGLAAQAGWLRGDGATELTIREHDWRFDVDIAHGHKTGFYLDQRDNRRHFADMVRRLGVQRVLNCYCYTGGFSIAALAGGASQVLSVDSSGPALARAEAHVRANGFAAERHATQDADVNAMLRAQIDAGTRFDAIVLDPPKFAPTGAHAERAARAYKDINRLALKLLAPGGLLFTFSCSGGIGPELFHKIVAGAGIDAGVDAAILQRLEAGPDHPTTLFFPEGSYLKGLALLKA